MNKLIFLTALVLPTLLAGAVFAGPLMSNGGRGGGDSVSRKFVNVAEIQNALTESAVPILLWLNALEIQGRKKNPQSDGVFLGKSFDEVFDILNSLIVHYRPNAACVSDKSHSKDGSVVSQENFEICISGRQLSRKLDKLTYHVQIEALVVHELLHLIGGDEEQAKEYQRRYLSDMQGVARENILAEATSVVLKIQNLAVALGSLSVDPSVSNNLCARIRELQFGFPNSDLSSLRTASVLSYRQTSLLADYKVVLGEMWPLLTCGNEPGAKAEALRRSYDAGFAGEAAVPVRRWLLNRSFSSRGSGTESYLVRRVDNQQEFEAQAAEIKKSLINMAWEIRYRLRMRPTLIIE